MKIFDKVRGWAPPLRRREGLREGLRGGSHPPPRNEGPKAQGGGGLKGRLKGGLKGGLQGGLKEGFKGGLKGVKGRLKGGGP